MRGAMGKVYIVGAGPGDPELITIKAIRRIQEADVIMYDKLVNEQLLEYARPDADLVYCGKAPMQHMMTQEQINRALVSYTLKGKKVVRLKGGDPFVFGRGGEEILELAANGIAYEVVPGVTSVIGATAGVGIPITHRGYAASFACVTGNRCEDSSNPVRWDLLAHSVDTLAIYMGVSQLADIQEQLLGNGKLPSTPVALIEQGTTVNQRVFTGTLEDMNEIATRNKLTNPALIIIGEVVRVREELRYAYQQAEVMNKIS